jgi:hypothetical protein
LWKVQVLKLGHQRLVIRTIRLTSADVYEADALATIDDERGRPSDVKCGQPQAMIDAITLDHRAVRVNEDWEAKAASACVCGHLRGALANDHHDCSAERLIDRQMSLQLLQLQATVGSPGAANEHHHGGLAVEDIGELNLLAVVSLQHEWRCRITDAELCGYVHPLPSRVPTTSPRSIFWELNHTTLPAWTPAPS